MMRARCKARYNGLRCRRPEGHPIITAAQFSAGSYDSLTRVVHRADPLELPDDMHDFVWTDD